MSAILFEALKLIVMIIVAVAVTRVIPLIKANVAQDKLDSFRQWTMDAVLYAQQILWSEDGQVRKNVVVRFLKQIRDEQGLDITDEQIEILIEAAVRQMNIEDDIGYIGMDNVIEIGEVETDETEHS